MKNSEKNSSASLRIDLNVIEESEEHFNQNENELLDEEENLRYNSEYKTTLDSSNYNYYGGVKEKENVNKVEINRKSTLSTSLSLSEGFQEKNGFSPVKSLVNNNNKKIIFPEYKKSNSSSNNNSKNNSPHIFFGRERFNSTPLAIYYEGADAYLRELQPEKKDYQKSNNYIKKNDFFKDFYPKDFFRYNNTINSTNNSGSEITYEENNQNYSSINSTPKLSVDFCYNYNINNNNKDEIESSHSSKDFPSTPSNSLENSLCQTDASSTNNLPKFNTNNSIYGKFDFPMYCVGYYSFDCKYIY